MQNHISLPAQHLPFDASYRGDIYMMAAGRQHSVTPSYTNTATLTSPKPPGIQLPPIQLHPGQNGAASTPIPPERAQPFRSLPPLQTGDLLARSAAQRIPVSTLLATEDRSSGSDRPLSRHDGQVAQALMAKTAPLSRPFQPLLPTPADTPTYQTTPSANPFSSAFPWPPETSSPAEFRNVRPRLSPVETRRYSDAPTLLEPSRHPYPTEMMQHHAHSYPPGAVLESPYAHPTVHSPVMHGGSISSQHDPSCPSQGSEYGDYSQSHPGTPQMTQAPPFDFKLVIRQQPRAARACGFGERDRRVVDPPPILQLEITSKTTGAPESDSAMLAMHCTLLSRDGKEDETLVDPQHDLPTTKRLMGTTVASGYPAKDENGVAGTFFVLPDLSCRSPGQYRLKFTLLRVDPLKMTRGTKHANVASIVSDVFSVYTAKEFPGMRASSALLKALRKQGLNVGVKKGSDARKGKSKFSKSAESDSDDGNEDSSGASEGEEEEADRRHNSPSSADASPKSKKLHSLSKNNSNPRKRRLSQIS